MDEERSANTPALPSDVAPVCKIQYSEELGQLRGIDNQAWVRLGGLVKNARRRGLFALERGAEFRFPMNITGTPIGELKARGDQLLYRARHTD